VQIAYTNSSTNRIICITQSQMVVCMVNCSSSITLPPQLKSRISLVNSLELDLIYVLLTQT